MMAVQYTSVCETTTETPPKKSPVPDPFFFGLFRVVSPVLRGDVQGLKALLLRAIDNPDLQEIVCAELEQIPDWPRLRGPAGGGGAKCHTLMQSTLQVRAHRHANCHRQPGCSDLCYTDGRQNHRRNHHRHTRARTLSPTYPRTNYRHHQPPHYQLPSSCSLVL